MSVNYKSKCSLKYINPHGYLITIYGPMFASKTDYLLMLLGIRMGIKQKILIINNIIDDRPDINSSGILSSHRDSPGKVKDAKQISTSHLANIPISLIESHDVIGIDEAQFFDDITLVFEWLKLGKTVITAGLMFTSECKPFGKYYLLLSHADETIPLTAVCLKCKEDMESHGVSGITQPANMSKCLKIKTDDVMVSSDEYIPVCRYHYYN